MPPGELPSSDPQSLNFSQYIGFPVKTHAPCMIEHALTLVNKNYNFLCLMFKRLEKTSPLPDPPPPHVFATTNTMSHGNLSTALVW